MAAGDRLRISELAALAGVSTQQVRNYVDAGLLPPVERTVSGYRVFTRAHAEALRVARTLAAGHGWRATGDIMRAANAGDLGRVLALVDASHGDLQRQRTDLAGVVEAVEALVRFGEGFRQGSRRGLLIGDAARVAGVRPPVLRQWEGRGLIRPRRDAATGYRRYPDLEVRAAQVVAQLRRGHYPFDVIAAVIEEMRSTGSPERVRRELAKRAQALAGDSARRLGASAALYGYLKYRGLVS